MLDLRTATIVAIHDEPGNWPQRTALDMLTYQALDPVLPADRLVWLARGDGSYHPQPYEQLAAHYRWLGHDDDARAVLLARHRHRRRTLRPPGRRWAGWTAHTNHKSQLRSPPIPESEAPPEAADHRLAKIGPPVG